MLTTFNEVNMTPINIIRNQDEFKAKHGGVGLGYMSFFTKAVTRALKLYPDVNSMMDGDYKIAYDSVIYQSQYQDQRFNGSCCS
jgi:2-oxoglutarate dehydrogenase E2 component (dihydrolipoamide succinyltransferase)